MKNSNDEILTQPEVAKLSPKHQEHFDLIIIGAGPAGMSAALAAARAKLKILVIEKALPGGETTTACVVDNYLGFPGGILGEDLSKRMEDQMTSYEGIYYTCETVEDIQNPEKKEKIVITDLENRYTGNAIIICVGLEPKKLDAPFEKRFLGRGISYCARCDIDSYKDKVVTVIGGGNCACYAADYLSSAAERIYIVHRKGNLRAVASLKNKILNTPNITIMWDSEVSDVFGLDKVEKIKVTNNLNQQHTWIDCSGIFVYDGRIPPEEILSLDLHMDEKGYIITDEYMRTNLPGIYAAGDIRVKQVRQIATAVSDGMIAAINAERDLLG